MSPPHPPICFILEDIRSAYNVGACFRVADCLGIEKLFLCGITPEPSHREVRKTALGAEEHVAWQKRSSTTELLEELQREGYQLIAVEQTSQAVALQEAFFPEELPLAFIFGNEVFGVSAAALALATSHVQIPMAGHKKSLNVSTAVAIVAWEWHRRVAQP